MAELEIKLEKRILPLLDITLILVGILILVIGNPNLGEKKVFVAQLEGNQLTHRDVIIFDGSQLNPANAKHMIRQALSGGFSRVEIWDDGTSPKLSYSVVSRIEQTLQKIAQELSSQEEFSYTPTIRYVPQNE